MPMGSDANKGSFTKGYFQPLNVYGRNNSSGNSRNINFGRNNTLFYKLSKIGASKIILTILLFILGLILVMMGTYRLFSNRNGYGLAIFVGILSLTPGTYGLYEIIGTLYNWSGFEEVSSVEDISTDEDWAYAV